MSRLQSTLNITNVFGQAKKSVISDVHYIQWSTVAKGNYIACVPALNILKAHTEICVPVEALHIGNIFFARIINSLEYSR